MPRWTPVSAVRSPRVPLSGVVGAALVALVVVGALLAPALTGGDPGAMSNLAFVAPAIGHPMGTDDLGREAGSA